MDTSAEAASQPAPKQGPRVTHGHTVWEVRSTANELLMWLFLKKTNNKFHQLQFSNKKDHHAGIKY